jgi:hypothetical protein
MRKVRSLFLLIILINLFLFSFSESHAQIVSIKGTIFSKDCRPIDGATVVIKGTNTGVTSDAKGFFKINTQVGKLLQISVIGFITEEVKAETGKELKIILQEINVELDQVVVVGYGTQKKVNLTGSVVSIKGDVLAGRNSVQTSQALQGMAAGVTVSSNNGKPGKENYAI